MRMQMYRDIISSYYNFLNCYSLKIYTTYTIQFLIILIKYECIVRIHSSTICYFPIVDISALVQTIEKTPRLIDHISITVPLILERINVAVI